MTDDDHHHHNHIITIIISRFDSCADLCVFDPSSCVRYALKLVRTLKIPYPSVVKYLATQVVVWSHELNILHTLTRLVMNSKLGSATLSQLAFLWEIDPNFPWENKINKK